MRKSIFLEIWVLFLLPKYAFENQKGRSEVVYYSRNGNSEGRAEQLYGWRTVGGCLDRGPRGKT